ncbi:MAG: PIN domain-containing protein [Bacillota bacterium]|nr:PIN domain-containing protein [Bacillota bacterium]
MSGEGKRLFLDTNVLVYAHDSSAGMKHSQAKQVIQSLWDSRDGCLSIQVLQEFYVAVTRKVRSPLSATHARQVVSDLSTWALHSPTAGDIMNAIDIQQESGLSFWDAMIIQSALQLGATCILSEDLNPGQRLRGIVVVNPFRDRSSGC